MAKIRELLGPATVEVAVRRRICHRNRRKHSIDADTKCLVVKDAASGGRKNYCPKCAGEILSQAEKDLARLRHELTD